MRRGIATAARAPLFFAYSGTQFATACNRDCAGGEANCAGSWLHRRCDCAANVCTAAESYKRKLAESLRLKRCGGWYLYLLAAG